MTFTKRFFQCFMIMLLLSSCTYRPAVRPLSLTLKDTTMVTKKDVSVVFVPANQRMPAHLLITKNERYNFLDLPRQIPFSREITINPLMHNVSMIAKVEKNNKVQREYPAQKIAQTIVNKAKTMWTPARPKLALLVPYLSKDEEVSVTTSYAWMDVRWHWPILFEEDEATLATQITIDVPYGVSSHFQVSNAGEAVSLIPKNYPLELPIWGQRDNRAGLGTRFVFAKDFGDSAATKARSQRLQLYFSFSTPSQHENAMPLDNWEKVSAYLYDRIDRYDFPADAIKEFANKETKDKTGLAKITRVLSFLSHEIEKRAVTDSYQEQEVQPATKTFSKRFGSAFDIAILAKAMLSSIGIDAELLALAHPDQNPTLTNFYSPALFYSVIVAINLKDRSYYFDPNSVNERLDQIPTDLQGASVLSIKKHGGQFFALPYEAASSNQTNYELDLQIDADGKLAGNFSVNLSGRLAKIAKEILAEPSKISDPHNLQNLLGLGTNSLVWQSAVPDTNMADGSVTIGGSFNPRLLAKNEGQDYVITPADIIEPAITALSLNQKKFSSMLKISATIALPDHISLTSPSSNLSLEHKGISARFSLSGLENVLNLEAMNIISLPIKKESQDILATEQEKIQAFGAQKLVLGLTTHEANGVKDHQENEAP